MTDYNCDVLVVGSGAGGLATAATAAHHRLNVLVVKKEPVFGGTSARFRGLPGDRSIGQILFRQERAHLDPRPGSRIACGR